MAKIAVEYVGSEGSWKDTIYGSGITWDEFNKVQLVPGAAALRLLRHPEFEDARTDEEKEAWSVEEQAHLPEKVDPEAALEEHLKENEHQMPLVNLEGMTKEALIQFAHQQFGVPLSPSLKKAEMIESIRLQSGRKVA